MAFVLKNIVQPIFQRQLKSAIRTNCLHTSTVPVLYTATKEGTNEKQPATPVSNLAPEEQKLLLSDSCIKRLREVCQDGSFLRLTVEGGGCSGFQYKFDLDKQLNEDDRVFGEQKAQVVIDTTSLEYCAGATVDYHTELIRAGFKVLSNPQAEQGCSCGASFAIRLD